VKLFRPKLPRTEAWKQVIDVIREEGPKRALSLLTERMQYEDGETELIKQEYGKVYSQSRIIKTQDDLKEVIDFDEDKYRVTKGYNKSWGVSAKSADGNSFIYNTNYAVTLEWKLRGLERPDTSWTDAWLKEFCKGVRFPEIEYRDNSLRPLVVALGDIHIGAITEGDELVPDYNKEIAEQSLIKLATYINNMFPDRDVYYMIGGDIIESFSGKNHKNSWKTLELHGAKAALHAFDLLYKLFQSTKGFKKAFLVGGNHDRISSSNEDDTRSQVAELVAGMFHRTSNVDIEYDSLYIATEIDGIRYILHHGDKRLSSKNGAEMVLDYGDSTKYNVIIGFHKHKLEVIEDTLKYRKITVPPIVKSTEFAKEIGAHSPSGFAAIEAMFDGRTTLQIVNI
jgi:hypothetical protein